MPRHNSIALRALTWREEKLDRNLQVKGSFESSDRLQVDPRFNSKFNLHRNYLAAVLAAVMRWHRHEMQL